MHTATEVDVANPVAGLYQPLHSVVGDVSAVAEVNIVEILAESSNGIHRGIRDVAALSKHEIAQPGSNLDDLFDRTICESGTRCQVEDPQMLIGLVRRQGEKGAIVNELAVGESKFAERLALGEQICNRLVAD